MRRNKAMDNKKEANKYVMKKKTQLFEKKEELFALLKILFRYEYPDIPSDSFSGVSIETVHALIDTMFRKLQTMFKEKPSIINWLCCESFEESFVSLALLFIELYEQHPSPLESKDCNFREIYHFLYTLTMNQPPSPLLGNSAKVLHTLISEILDEVWPDMQNDFLKYFSETYQYSRSIRRRTYPGKKNILEQNII